jgi:thioredoxin-related protein
MKLLKYKLLFLTIIILSSFSTSEKNITNVEKNVKWMSFEEAVTASKEAKANGETPKKIFIDVYTDWCGWCKKMDKNTFENPKISAYLNENFYPVKFNAEQKENIEFNGRTFKFVDQGRRGYHELAAGLMKGKMSYPTVVFMDEDLNLIQSIPGYMDVPKFDMIIRYLGEDIYENKAWPEYQKEYQATN